MGIRSNARVVEEKVQLVGSLSGFPMTSQQLSWDFVEEEMMGFFRGFHEHG